MTTQSDRGLEQITTAGAYLGDLIHGWFEGEVSKHDAKLLGHDIANWAQTGQIPGLTIARPVPVTAEVSEEQQSFLIQLATNERDRCLRHYQDSVECYADYSEGKMAANFIGCTFSPRDRLNNDKGAYEMAELSLAALSAALKAQKGVGG